MGRAGRGGGSFGGGGRSSGFGGGRISGGRSGGSSRGGFGGGFPGRAGNSRGSGSSGGFGFGGGPVFHTGPHYRPFFGFGGPKQTSGNLGCGTVVTVFAIIIIFIFVFSIAMNIGFDDDNITKSTIERTPLDKSFVNETAYYKDDIDWIFNSAKLEDGMRAFYNKTGVQPFLYITDNVDGDHYPSNAEFEAFANKFYDEHFTDEAHILIIFKEYNREYTMWYVVGSAAKSVMDEEAVDILLDYIEKYYYSDMPDEEMFSNAFANAADKIMQKKVSYWPYIITVIVIIIAIILIVKAYKSYKDRKEKEAKEMEEMLKKPLETFGNDDLNDLEEKYK